MRVLILSCDTGQGHNAAALALLEALQRHGITAEKLDALSFGGETVSRVVSNAYMKVAAEAPWLFGGMYKAGDLISSNRIKSPVYFANTRYAENMRRYIEESQTDVVLCPHLFPAEALTYLRGKGLLRTACYAVATDYTCIPFWEETRMDGWFIPHEDLRCEFAGKGIPTERLITSGIPTSARFREQTDQASARRALNLPEEKPMILIMTGSMGFGHTVALTERLAPSGATICILTGKNLSLVKQVEEQFVDQTNVRAIPFTNQVSLYMDACNVLLTKPGGLSSTEAAVHNVPLVLTMPIPGCETQNAAFFKRRGMAVCVQSSENAALEALTLLLNAQRQRVMLAAQKATINPMAADDIARYLLAHHARQNT